GAKKNGKVVTTLIDQFKYPRHGPGQLWENVTKTLDESESWEVRLNARVVGVSRSVDGDDGSRVQSVTFADHGGDRHELAPSHLFSSSPLRSLLNAMTSAPPPNVLSAANALKYRDFLTIVLVIDKPDMFPDNWIYVHAPEVKMGRIQNFKNWSPFMVPDAS